MKRSMSSEGSHWTFPEIVLKSQSIKVVEIGHSALLFLHLTHLKLTFPHISLTTLQSTTIMKFLKIASIATVAFAVCSFIPSAGAAAIERRDVASDAKGILDQAKSEISPIKARKLLS